MNVKRFREQINDLTQLMSRTVPKKYQFVIGHGKETPMATRIYLTEEDPKLIAAGQGRTDVRYVTINGDFSSDTLTVALRQDLNGIENESAVLGTFSGPVRDKLSQAALVILSWLVNGDKPALTH